jgi:hypothetical protein
MEMLGSEFYSGLTWGDRDSVSESTSIEQWEQEKGVSYPSLTTDSRGRYCKQCVNSGLWRSCGGSTSYGINVGIANGDNYRCIVPCYLCAKENNFHWGVSKTITDERCIPCNGVRPGEDKEMTTHELVVLEINMMYDKMHEEGLIHPLSNSWNVVAQVMDEMLHKKPWFPNSDSSYRLDIEQYTRFIKGEWMNRLHPTLFLSLHLCTQDFGSSMHGEIIRMNNYLSDNSLIQLLEQEYLESLSRDIEQRELTNEIVHIDNEVLDMKQQCRKGIDILDEIMSPSDSYGGLMNEGQMNEGQMNEGLMNEGQMNEGQYKELMEIFQHLFINS